jgi:3'-phosphoadenosine 5'-phosphosulfate sulfotransferase (PAPS reductase)/FAD synthetase
MVITEHSLPLDEVIFADTGAELPETYAYIREHIRPFLKQHNIPYVEVQAKETLMERCIRSRAIPDKRYRWSTRDYKIRPINKHLREHLVPNEQVVVYLGIAYDEPTRVKPSREKWIRRYYPLIDHGMNREDCEKYIEAHQWPIPPKSGCYFCPFQRLSQWRNLLEKHPDLYEKAIMIEKNGSKYPNFALREGTTLEHLRKRFEREAISEREQSKLDQYQEECEGFCFT